MPKQCFEKQFLQVKPEVVEEFAKTTLTELSEKYNINRNSLASFCYRWDVKAKQIIERTRKCRICGVKEPEFFKGTKICVSCAENIANQYKK